MSLFFLGTVMTRRAVVTTAYILLLAWPCFARGNKPRSGNGIRLVGASGSRGRLEISSTAAWLLAEGEEIAWRPVCAIGGLIDNNVAQIMCKLIGYKYGRRYFSPDVVYRAPPDGALPSVYDPVGYVYCNPSTGRRRLAGSDPQSDGEGGGSSAAVNVVETGAETNLFDGSSSNDFATHRHHRNARSLLAPLYGNISIPATAPYQCRFRLGDCDYTGPLVGIECFNRKMPPAPPPPPSPPYLPPAPPPGSMSIRLMGPNGGPLETNICPSPTFCQYFNRVELQVPHPDGGDAMIWAPLCSAPTNFTNAIGNLACWQVYNWPRFARRLDFVVISQASTMGFPIPQSNTTSNVTLGTYCTTLVLREHVP
ncbi:hypothetical protein Vretimale_15945 [Volvox reticuliferus]|uniref:SRCR domain-containing protein n=2 Tax=Volvox reticuliferus TaxID=1737510 RepID=A0A8J4GPZ4_9CHLO|nr:hypothetical protein Vretimale_15945 [Volvox reticuliferus]